MNRRTFLASSVGSAGIFAGCLSDPESREITDTTGTPDEPNPDSYNPSTDYDTINQTEPTTPNLRTDPNDTPSTTVPSETPSWVFSPNQSETRTPKLNLTNTIEVDTSAVKDRTHHFVRYSVQKATIQIYSDLLNNTYSNGAKVLVVASTYPTKTSHSIEMLAQAKSDPITGINLFDRELTVELNFDIPADQPFYLWAVLLQADADFSEVTTENVDSLAETDKLKISNGRLNRDSSSLLPFSLKRPQYERIEVEGEYLLSFSGGNLLNRWDATFTASKVGYIEAKIRSRTYDWVHYPRTGLDNGNADSLGAILNDTAENNGYQTDREKVDFLIDFVQNLPYVPDDVSTGRNEYPKYLIETLVDAGGDCEDSSILLSSVLLSPSFGYGAVLFLLPGHMAVGVKGGDQLPGSYIEYRGERYYYIETTGTGWNVGDVPDEYQGKMTRTLLI